MIEGYLDFRKPPNGQWWIYLNWNSIGFIGSIESLTRGHSGHKSWRIRRCKRCNASKRLWVEEWGLFLTEILSMECIRTYDTQYVYICRNACLILYTYIHIYYIHLYTCMLYIYTYVHTYKCILYNSYSSGFVLFSLYHKRAYSHLSEDPGSLPVRFLRGSWDLRLLGDSTVVTSGVNLRNLGFSHKNRGVYHGLPWKIEAYPRLN